jgi:hypothetical protein
MSLYREVMAILKERGFIRPKRGGAYVPRVQIAGKTDERTQIAVLLLAYENNMSAGELIDLLCHELLENPKLLVRCLKRRNAEGWQKRTKYGQYEDWSVYKERKQRSGKERAAIEAIVADPMARPRPGSPEEKRRVKLLKIRDSRRSRGHC